MSKFFCSMCDKDVTLENGKCPICKADWSDFVDEESYVKNKLNKMEKEVEVVEVVGNVAKTIPFDNVIYLKKGIEVSKSDEPLSIEYSDQLLGRVFNSYGDLIDGTTIKKPKKRNIYDRTI